MPSNTLWPGDHEQSDDRTVYVGGLSTSTPLPTAQQLAAFFQNYGSIVGVRIPIDEATGGQKTFAFVTFVKAHEAKSLLRAGSVHLFGKRCNVRPRIPPKQTPRSSVASFTLDAAQPVRTTNDDNEAAATATTTTRPPLCPSLSCDRVTVTVNDPRDEKNTFSVATWNILADCFTNSHFHYCPEASLHWTKRLPLLCQQLVELDADVLCVQELEASTEPSIAAFMKNNGYGWLYLTKNIENKPKVDGIGFAFRIDRFECLESLAVRPLVPEAPQCGIAAHLKHRASGNTVIVANAHLSSAKLEEDRRLRQARSLIDKAMAKFCPTAANDRSRPNFVFCGDLNSEPRWGLVSELSDAQQWDEVYSGGGRAAVAFASKQYTVFMPFTQDQLDYIFFSPPSSTESPATVKSSDKGTPSPPRGLRLVSLLRVPCDLDIVRAHQNDVKEVPREALRNGTMRFEMLPVPSFPSDHLPLRCCLEFC